MRNASGHRCKVKISGSEKKKKKEKKKKRFEDKGCSGREREHVRYLLHKTCN